MPTRPAPGEYAAYYASYVDLVSESDIVAALATQAREIDDLLRSIPETEAGVVHAPYGWTIKQVIGHLIDGERIFSCRALRFARGDTTALPGFDENAYARTGQFDRLAVDALADEFASVRQSTLHLFRHLPESAWAVRGEANGQPISVRALAFVMAGHVRHHLSIIRRRLSID